jgi:hypothetical protein
VREAWLITNRDREKSQSNLFTLFPPFGSEPSKWNRISVVFSNNLDDIWEKETTQLQGLVDECLSSLDPSTNVIVLAKDIHDVCKADSIC